MPLCSCAPPSPSLLFVCCSSRTTINLVLQPSSTCPTIAFQKRRIQRQGSCPWPYHLLLPPTTRKDPRPVQAVQQLPETLLLLIFTTLYLSASRVCEKEQYIDTKLPRSLAAQTCRPPVCLTLADESQTCSTHKQQASIALYITGLNSPSLYFCSHRKTTYYYTYRAKCLLLEWTTTTRND